MCKSAVHLHMHTQMVYGIFCSNIGFVYIATQLLLLWIWFGGTLLHMWECEYKRPDQLQMPSCLCNHYFMQLLINYHASVTSCDPFLYTALHIILLVLCLYARYIRLVQAVYSFITLKIYVGLNIFPWCIGHSGASSLARHLKQASGVWLWYESTLGLKMCTFMKTLSKHDPQKQHEY